MANKIETRPATRDDLTSLEHIYAAAFPDEDLLPLIHRLLNKHCNDVLSLVAVADIDPIAHVLFTFGTVDDDLTQIALLAPLAVAAPWQHRGIGSRLVRDGLDALSKANITEVFVLGDPNYYSRFGFAQEDCVQPPYPLAKQWLSAWQSLTLAKRAEDKVNHRQRPSRSASSRIVLPETWLQPALWTP